MIYATTGGVAYQVRVLSDMAHIRVRVRGDYASLQAAAHVYFRIDSLIAVIRAGAEVQVEGTSASRVESHMLDGVTSQARKRYLHPGWGTRALYPRALYPSGLR